MWALARHQPVIPAVTFPPPRAPPPGAARIARPRFRAPRARFARDSGRLGPCAAAGFRAPRGRPWGARAAFSRACRPSRAACLTAPEGDPRQRPREGLADRSLPSPSAAGPAQGRHAAAKLNGVFSPRRPIRARSLGCAFTRRRAGTVSASLLLRASRQSSGVECYLKTLRVEPPSRGASPPCGGSAAPHREGVVSRAGLCRATLGL